MAKEHLDHQVLLGLEVFLVLLGHQEEMVMMDCLEKKDLQDLLEGLVSQVYQVLKVLLEKRAIKEILVYLDNLEILD